MNSERTCLSCGGATDFLESSTDDGHLTYFYIECPTCGFGLDTTPFINSATVYRRKEFKKDNYGWWVQVPEGCLLVASSEEL